MVYYEWVTVRFPYSIIPAYTGISDQQLHISARRGSEIWRDPPREDFRIPPYAWYWEASSRWAFAILGGRKRMEKRTISGKTVSPIVMAIRDFKEIPAVIKAPHKTVFLLAGTLNTIGDAVRTVREAGKDAFIHFDLIDGLGKDAHALRWVAESVKPTGIVTTRGPLIGQARSLGLATVQRMFLLDSQSIQTGLHIVKEVKPDFLEVLPGLIPEVIAQLVQKSACPIIAGGLCKTIAHYKAAREAGAVAMSTSDRDLWQYLAGR